MKSLSSEQKSYLFRSIRTVRDFPKPGILFYDITGILVNPEAFRFCIDAMVDIYRNEKIDAVAGVESRGFIFAAPFAEFFGVVGLPFLKHREVLAPTPVRTLIDFDSE